MEPERDMPECEKYNENVGNYDDNEMTTYERAMADDEQQADYERDDKLGAI